MKTYYHVEYIATIPYSKSLKKMEMQNRYRIFILD